jgi:superfamily II DNA or RNA helicase
LALVQIAANAVGAKLINADRQIKLEISELLSFQVDGYEHTQLYATGGWDGRSSLFQMRDGSFPAGFVFIVHKRLRQLGHDVKIVRQKAPPPLGPEFPVVDTFGDDPRYDYQDQTVATLLKYGQMIAQIATGGGKSRIAKKAVARIGRPTLFLTTRQVLMYQMKDQFDAMGYATGVLGDGEWSPKKQVNVGMVQTLMARLKEPDPTDNRIKRELKATQREKMIKLLGYFEFVILEEAHEVGGDSFYSILKHCRNAHYRLSLTATPFMRADGEANMRLMACSGPIGIKVSEKLLIERGILARPQFKFIAVPKTDKVFRTTGYQRALKYGIVQNEFRNRAICFEAIRGAKLGLTSMILVQRKEHGRILEGMLKAGGLKVKFIFGESDKATRDKALKDLASGKLDVLIGSTILDVGVDVPAVGIIILAGGGKAEVALRQRIGRGLRAKKKGPNVCFVVDFDDAINTHLREHAATRRSIIESTPGFVENILSAGADFEYASLGLSAVA